MTARICGGEHLAVARAGVVGMKHGYADIRVNAISAGPIKTLARGAWARWAMLKSHAERSPLHRNVDQLEVGGTALYLASDLASAVTGETLYVDCGYNIMGY